LFISCHLLVVRQLKTLKCRIAIRTLKAAIIIPEDLKPTKAQSGLKKPAHNTFPHLKIALNTNWQIISPPLPLPPQKK
jgi:hypothetical protein